MSYEEISYKHVIGRNEYYCNWCNEKILKKEKHMARAYKFEGDFNSDRMHLECEQAMYKLPSDELSMGFEGGEFQRGSILQKSAVGKNFIEDSLCE